MSAGDCRVCLGFTDPQDIHGTGCPNAPVSAEDRCGGRWNCVLPAGHNMGKVDIPENHQPPSAGDRDTLAALLAEHYPIRDEGTEQVVCWCLWKPETRLYGFAEWDAVRAHVADVLLASDWLREQRAEAWDEGAEAYSAVKRVSQWADPVNPYQAMEDSDG